jgi:hypothetical protein
LTARFAISHDYAAPAETVYQVAVDYPTLSELSAGLVHYRGLPEGRMTRGDVVDIEVSTFGLLPWSPYQIEVVELDPAAHRFVTHERGAGIKHWHHDMRIVATETGARQTDSLEIDAGAMTPLIAAFAKHMYRKRHGPRQRLLGL